MFADLHIHTQFSDGTLKPEEVVEKAKRLAIEIISICDHNTLEAYRSLKQLCRNNNLKLINGVEIDCMMGNHYLHVLGYGFDLHNSQLNEMLLDCKTKMNSSNELVIKNMIADYPIDLGDFNEWVSPPEIGGYKNSNYLLDKGIIKNIDDYFPLHKKFGVSIESIGLPKLADVCKIVKSAGGFPILAHPGNWWSEISENFNEILNEIHDSGISGIECFYPSHSEKLTKICVDFCNDNNLLITAGSDEHGEFNKVINGVTYEIGEITVDTGKLNLRGLV